MLRWHFAETEVTGVKHEQMFETKKTIVNIFRYIRHPCNIDGINSTVFKYRYTP